MVVEFGAGGRFSCLAPLRETRALWYIALEKTPMHPFRASGVQASVESDLAVPSAHALSPDRPKQRLFLPLRTASWTTGDLMVPYATESLCAAVPPRTRIKGLVVPCTVGLWTLQKYLPCQWCA